MPESEELRLVQQMARSRYWRWMRGYLIDRREALLNTPAPTNAALHQQKGAVDEVTRLLHAPELVSKFLLQQQTAEAQEPEPEPPVPEWLTKGHGDVVE